MFIDFWEGSRFLAIKSANCYAIFFYFPPIFSSKEDKLIFLQICTSKTAIVASFEPVQKCPHGNGKLLFNCLTTTVQFTRTTQGVVVVTDKFGRRLIAWNLRRFSSPFFGLEEACFNKLPSEIHSRLSPIGTPC